ncbi:hypothetical protein B0H14DRAFT_2651942 [Mycena olivaceomarginata]|nr:hypothetical protein B0H14DRAFT_2651942 [Mycena olivaceomarginata]
MYFFSLLYLFVAKFGGTGWDNDEKHATNTAEYIRVFHDEFFEPFLRSFSWSFLREKRSKKQSKNDGKKVQKTHVRIDDTLFGQVHGTRCFRAPCPFYDKLDKIYHGMIDKATGENVLQLGTKKKHKRKSKANESAAFLEARPSTASAHTIPRYS